MIRIVALGFAAVMAAALGACARPYYAPRDSGGGTAAPDSSAGPGTDATGPAATDAAGPGTDATLPGTDANLPGTDAAPPGTDAAPPGTDAAPPIVCGNGIVEPGEACDDGNDGNQSNACLDGCVAAACGDGFLFSGVESCDDGNLAGGDGCSATCTFEPGVCSGSVFGPDAYGYVGCASTPAVLPCDDISATGTNALLSDDSHIFVAIGFSFDFYGTAASSVAIGSNGNLNFADAYLGLGNVCIPGTSGYVPTQFIATFWDDLNPSAGGAVRYQLLGTTPNRRFVVQWAVAHYGSSSTGTIDVRAVLYEGTNDIDVCYVDGSFGDASYDNGLSATAGLQQSTSAGLAYSCNTSSLTSGLLLHYDHP